MEVPLGGELLLPGLTALLNSWVQRDTVGCPSRALATAHPR